MTVIKEMRIREERIPAIIAQILPPRLYAEVERISKECISLDEIRIRAGRRASVTSFGKNILLESVTDAQTVGHIMEKICEGSLYAHADTISRGYVTLSGGIRIGVVGRAAVSGDRIIGVYDISALCIRLPRGIMRVGAPVCVLLREMKGNSGVLIYAPPGQGKTTLLRAVAAEMASGENPWRVIVVDSRGELGLSLDSPELCLEVMTGYPRAEGMEIAVRSMNAQLVVCDEIGDVSEAEAIIAAQNCGVPLLASAHGESVEGILRRTGIKKLHSAGIFGAYVGIKRKVGCDYEYSVRTYGEIDEHT